MAMCPSELLCFEFVFNWFSQVDLAKFGNNSVLPQVNNKDILPLVMPIPPLAEQQVIVERVERLMTICRELYVGITQSRNHAADLLQAVLREAFAPPRPHDPSKRHSDGGKVIRALAETLDC
jgi:type I restriction enzyme S subunit